MYCKCLKVFSCRNTVVQFQQTYQKRLRHVTDVQCTVHWHLWLSIDCLIWPPQCVQQQRRISFLHDHRWPVDVLRLKILASDICILSFTVSWTKSTPDKSETCPGMRNYCCDCCRVRSKEASPLWECGILLSSPRDKGDSPGAALWPAPFSRILMRQCSVYCPLLLRFQLFHGALFPRRWTPSLNSCRTRKVRLRFFDWLIDWLNWLFLKYSGNDSRCLPYFFHDRPRKFMSLEIRIVCHASKINCLNVL